MFNMEELLARLQNGEDATVIANEFAGVLNNAIQEQAKIAEAQKIEETRNADAQFVVDTIVDFLKKYYPELAGADSLDMTGADLCEVMDELNETLIDITKLFKGHAPKIKIATNLNTDPISEFLKVNKLL